MTGSSLKPAWLVAFHAHLRARPVFRATLWAVMSGAIVGALQLNDGATVSIERLATWVAVWALAGVLFYGVMRWWEARNAR